MSKEIDEILNDGFFKILKETSKLKNGESKQIECPKCKNKIFIQRSAYNGHIFVNCETDNCIKIIQ